MRQYILSLLAVAVSTIFVGCKQNDGPYELSSFSDYSLISSAYTWHTSEGNIDINTTVAFMNLSKGNSNYFWEIQDGCHFLKPDYVLGDSDFTPYIFQSGGYIRDTKAYVLFEEEGEFEVRVYNEFDEYVYFDPAPSRPDLGLFYEAIYNRHIGKWVTDYSFKIKVVGSADMSLSVNVNEEQKHSFSRNFTYDPDSTNWGVVEIDSGDSVVYKVEELFGYPNEMTCSDDSAIIELSDSTCISVGDTVTVTYDKAGEFKAGSVTIGRSSEFVKDIASSSKKITIPLIIKVNEL
ncbi:MAG: hypothetical protein SNH01_08665 [Rikenellaceae bacterium]